MNYQFIYDNIIEKNKTLSNQSQYTERHHILPKCMGGCNKKSNIVRLSYREHFLCHWLLCKIHPENHKLKAAFAKMLGVGNKQQRQIASWQFEAVKRNIRDVHFHWLKNKEPWNKGKKECQVAWNKGIKTGPMSEQQKQDISFTLKRHWKTTIHPRKGKGSWCKGTKGVVKAWNKGKSMPTFKCPHCSREMSQVNLIRWHGPKCKSLRSSFESV